MATSIRKRIAATFIGLALTAPSAASGDDDRGGHLEAGVPAASSMSGRVRIASPEVVVLEVQDGSNWRAICQSPCDAVLTDEGIYRINGSDVVTSNSFRLEPGVAYRLDVRPKSSAERTGAIFIATLGAAGLVPAVVVTALFPVALLLCPHGANCLGYAAIYGNPYVWIPAAAGTALVVTAVFGIGVRGTDVRTTTSEAVPAAHRIPDWRRATELREAPRAMAPIVDVAF